MNESLQTAYTGSAGSGVVEQRNRVLRNTYWLLALSLVPTVLGAWIGVSTGIAGAMTRHQPDRLPGRRVRLHVRHREDEELRRRRGDAAGVHVLHGPDAVAPARRGARPCQRRVADHDGLRRHRRDLPRHGHAGHDDQARPVDDGQVPVRRRDHAAHRRHREHLPAVERADAHRCGARHRHLLGLHAVRPEARASTAARPTTSPPRSAIYLDIYNVFQSLLALLGIFGGERE